MLCAYAYRYVDYAIDVPMYFVYRNGNYVNALGQSFRDFMAGKLPALPGGYSNQAQLLSIYAMICRFVPWENPFLDFMAG